MIQKANLQGIIALIIIGVGLYILGWNGTDNDVKIGELLTEVSENPFFNFETRTFYNKD